MGEIALSAVTVVMDDDVWFYMRYDLSVGLCTIHLFLLRDTKWWLLTLHVLFSQISVVHLLSTWRLIKLRYLNQLFSWKILLLLFFLVKYIIQIELWSIWKFNNWIFILMSFKIWLFKMNRLLFFKIPGLVLCKITQTMLNRIIFRTFKI